MHKVGSVESLSGDASSHEAVGGMMLSETKRVSGHTVGAMAPANEETTWERRGEERRGEAHLRCGRQQGFSFGRRWRLFQIIVAPNATCAVVVILVMIDGSAVDVAATSCFVFFI